MKPFLIRHRKVVALIGVVVALCVAGLYLVYVPEEVAQVDVFRAAILRFGHSLCWVLLAIAGVLWGLQRGARAIAPLLYAALTVYAVFMVTLVLA